VVEGEPSFVCKKKEEEWRKIQEFQNRVFLEYFHSSFFFFFINEGYAAEVVEVEVVEAEAEAFEVEVEVEESEAFEEVAFSVDKRNKPSVSGRFAIQLLLPRMPPDFPRSPEGGAPGISKFREPGISPIWVQSSGALL